jgi:hypothetical protein
VVVAGKGAQETPPGFGSPLGVSLRVPSLHLLAVGVEPAHIVDADETGFLGVPAGVLHTGQEGKGGSTDSRGRQQGAVVQGDLWRHSERQGLHFFTLTQGKTV